MSILCKLGLHSWVYKTIEKNFKKRRICRRCLKRQLGTLSWDAWEWETVPSQAVAEGLQREATARAIEFEILEKIALERTP